MFFEDVNQVRGQRLFEVLRSRQTSLQAKVFGREHELSRMQAAFDRVCDVSCPSSEVVLIHGPSGCGKSSIARALVRWARENRSNMNVSFGSGKYDQLVNNEPFAAIVSASNELCKQLLKSDKEMIERFKERFRGLAGSDEDAKTLSDAIPYLTELVDDMDDLGEKYSSLAQAFTRFKQLWISFLLASSSCSDVTVLFLDDVQWADSNSLDLIHSLTKTAQDRNILLICAYRDDATVERAQMERLRWCFSLDRRRRESRKQPNRRNSRSAFNKVMMPLTDIKLDNLNDGGIHELVSGLLYGNRGPAMAQRKDLRELSEVISSHTQGNPFFTLHYLDHLSVLGLLVTEDWGETWEWNLFSIEHQEHVPETIGELLSNILVLLPEKIMGILTTAAHVGYKFSSTLLERETLINFGMPESSSPVGSTGKVSASVCNALIRDRIKSTLDEAVNEGLLEKRGKNSYTFPHDQIQQALYMTLASNPEKQKLLHLDIGRALLESIESANVDTETSTHISFCQEQAANNGALFVAVDNLNKGCDYLESLEERMRLVRLNYEAAQASLRKSAVEGALRYSRSAIALLDDDRWVSQYETTVDLYSLAARLEHCTGNLRRCNKLISDIQSHGKTIYDKLPAYLTQIDSLGNRGELSAAIKLGVMVLRQLGEPMPVRPSLIQVVRELAKAKRLMKTTRQNGFLNLPPMRNPAKVAAMSVLASIFLHSYVTGNRGKNLTAIALLRMLNISCVHGLSVHTPFGVAGFASVEGTLGDFKSAGEVANLSFELIETVQGAGALMGRTANTIYGIVSPWVGRSLPEIHPEFMRCYHSCFAHGDVDFAYYAIINHFCCAFMRGSPLDELNTELRKYINEMDEFQVHFPKYLSICIWNGVRALLGEDIDDTSPDSVLISRLENETETMAFNEIFVVADCGLKVIAKVILGSFGRENLVEDEKLLQRIGRYVDAFQTHYTRIFYEFIYGLGCLELYRQTNKRRHRKKARKPIKTLKFFNKTNAPVAVAPVIFLRAETMYSDIVMKTTAASSDDLDAVERIYLDAVADAQTSGQHLVLEALTYERIATISRASGENEQGDKYEGKALDLYAKWGATKKVELFADYNLDNTQVPLSERSSPLPASSF